MASAFISAQLNSSDNLTGLAFQPFWSNQSNISQIFGSTFVVVSYDAFFNTSAFDKAPSDLLPGVDLHSASEADL